MKWVTIILISVLIVALCVAIGYTTDYLNKRSPKPVASETLAPKGFWKDIEMDSAITPTRANAFFCSVTGSYQGHVVNSGGGWWETYIHDDKRGSYATEDFARKAIEQGAKCE